MEHENLNKEETTNSDLGVVGGSALPEGWLDWVERSTAPPLLPNVCYAFGFIYKLKKQ